MRRAGALAVTLGLAVTLSACRPGAVRLVFAPRQGAVYRYAVHVASTTTTTLTGQPMRTQRDTLDLLTTDTVVAVDDHGSTLRVEVTGRGAPAETYLVHLDQQAALSGIVTVDGQPATAPPQLQLEDLVPAAVGAPPDRRLRPGEHWRVDQAVGLPGRAPTRLVGGGHVDALGVLHGRRVAFTSASGFVDVSTADTSGAPAGRVGIRGRQSTTMSVTRSVDDGAVEQSTASTSGRFAVIVIDANGQPLVAGQLAVTVRSTTTRL